MAAAEVGSNSSFPVLYNFEEKKKLEKVKAVAIESKVSCKRDVGEKVRTKNTQI